MWLSSLLQFGHTSEEDGPPDHPLTQSIDLGGIQLLEKGALWLVEEIPASIDSVSSELEVNVST